MKFEKGVLDTGQGPRDSLAGMIASITRELQKHYFK
jgi:hypothetical protein